MKKVLVIGSTVVDIIINLDFLPKTSQDVHVLSQSLSLGGCAYNVSDIIRHFNIPYILFSPVGTGIYGDYIRNTFIKKGLPKPILEPKNDNGCCYCLVEASGERTFISNHGAEYLIYKEWLEKLDLSEIGAIYVCGLEIEETTGEEILEYLEEQIKNYDIPIYYATGPRINKVPLERHERLFNMHPILHLNDDEARDFTKLASVEDAIKYLYGKTNNTVIITCGENGAVVYDGKTLEQIPSIKAELEDSIGAGDSHIGSVIACRHYGLDMKQSIMFANRVSSKVVETKGALLSDESFEALNILNEIKNIQ